MKKGMLFGLSHREKRVKKINLLHFPVFHFVILKLPEPSTDCSSGHGSAHNKGLPSMNIVQILPFCDFFNRNAGVYSISLQMSLGGSEKNCFKNCFYIVQPRHQNAWTKLCVAA